MKSDEFAKRIYDSLVAKRLDTYRNIFDNKPIDEVTDEHWKRALNFYRSLPGDQNAVLLQIIEQTSVDTIASLFAVIDGVAFLEGADEKFTLQYGQQRLSGDLLDHFLALRDEPSDTKRASDG